VPRQSPPNDIAWLTMRRMRSPLIVLILVYVLSILAMVSVPGADADGRPYHLSFLDAAYFVAVLQTTIGLGEIPHTFTEAQRLLVYALLLPNVVAWLYSIGTLLGLLLDQQFQAVLRSNRFSRQVRWMARPFYIVCGFGNTGSLAVSGLLARGLRAVVVEKDPEAVHNITLDAQYAHVPALVASAANRHVLEQAGLMHPKCRGLIATTNDDHTNLTIAISAKLLRPGLTVLARSENQRVSDNLASFGTDYIINPYRIFAERLFLALRSPLKYLVQDWLISVPGSRLRDVVKPPTGHWIVCGAGRLGKPMLEQLAISKMPFTVVDVHPERLPAYERAVLGRGTEAHTLIDAGVHDAVGIIAATGDDIDNLSIIMTAHELNPKLFIIARQERRQHEELFDASQAHLVARRSMIVARRILTVVTAPLVQPFVQHMARADESFAEQTAKALRKVLRDQAPNLWEIELKDELAEGIRFTLARTSQVRIEHIILSSRSEEREQLDCVCLVLERGARREFLPASSTPLQENDRLLFAGRSSARREMLWTLHDSHSLLGNVTGKHLPRGALWRWLSDRRA